LQNFTKQFETAKYAKIRENCFSFAWFVYFAVDTK